MSGGSSFKGDLPPKALRIEEARDHARASRVAQGKPAEDPGDAELRALRAQRPQTKALFERAKEIAAAPRYTFIDEMRYLIEAGRTDDAPLTWHPDWPSAFVLVEFVANVGIRAT